MMGLVPGRLGVPTALVATVALGTLLNPLNSSMIAIALVPLQREFEVGVATVSWLVSAFYLSAAVGQPLVGRLIDILGGRRLFVAGLVTAGTASALAPFVPGFWWLVGMRVLQAVGTSAAFPAALVLIRAAAEGASTSSSDPGSRTSRGHGELDPGVDAPSAVEPDATGTTGASQSPAFQSAASRSSAPRPPAGPLAVLNIAAATSAALGPVLGGFLVAFAGWEAVFLVNVPITVTGVVLALRFLPRVPTTGHPATGHLADGSVPDSTATGRVGLRAVIARFLRRLDLPGVVLFAASLTGLLGFLLSLGTRPQWWLLPVVAVSGVLFYRRERATDTPFLDIVGLVANRRLSAVLGQQVGLNIVFYSIFFGMPLWLQSVRGISADSTGLLVLPIALMGVLTTPLAARTVRQQGSRATLVVGSAILLAATLLVQLLDDTTSLAVVAGLALLLGIPNGFNNLGLQTALYEASPPERMGSSGGLFQTCRYLGAILSTSVLGIVFEQDMTTRGLHQVGWIITGLAATLLVLALALGGRVRR